MKYPVLSIKIVCIFCILSTWYFLLARGISAFEMNSNDYRIQMGNINIGGASGLESPTSGNLLSDTLGQTAAMEFSSSGYILKAGFQYIHSIVPFSFTISDTRIDFDEILPNSPETATINLTVSFGGGGQYQVTVAENERLATLDGTNHIEDTCCDAGCGPNQCTESEAGVWISPDTTGFGYKMSDEDIPDTFKTCGDTCFRPFPDLSFFEDPAVVMSSPDVTVDLSSKPKDIEHQSTLTFKLNIDTAQPAGSYQTIINFVATPSY